MYKSWCYLSSLARHHIFTVNHCFKSLNLILELTINLVNILDLRDMTLQVTNKNLTFLSKLVSNSSQVVQFSLSPCVLFINSMQVILNMKLFLEHIIQLCPFFRCFFCQFGNFQSQFVFFLFYTFYSFLEKFLCLKPFLSGL